MACSNCGKPKVAAKGLCQTCYYRVRRNGSLQRTNVVNGGVCLVDGCGERAFAKNLCKRHYDKDRHPLYMLWRRIRSRHTEEVPNSWARLDAFLADIGERPTERHQLRRIDEGKPFSASNVKWLVPLGVRTADPSYARAWSIMRKFGLPLSEVEAMAERQNYRCSICRKPETALDRSGKVRPLCVDHCHTSERHGVMKVRDLLCNRCNHLLGLVGDDAALLRAAIAYLERHAAPIDAEPLSGQ